jgi:diguanylate cyclase (GGDEF)-like protein
MSAAETDEPPPGRRLWTPRLVGTLALFVLGVTFFCAVVGIALVRQADESQGLERRAALLGAIEDIRSSGADFAALDARHVKGMERTAGLKDLRFETEPQSGGDGGGREVQSVVDGRGRIIGWFSWESDHAMSNALGQLKPLLALTGVFLVGFAGIALWQVRRAVRDLGLSEQRAWALAYEDMLTGLPNHRKITEMIDETLARRGRGEGVSLAFLDVDGLKDINDALGHGIGDALLTAFAARLRDVLPSRAFCGRFDGDEFVAVMVGLEPASAHSAVESMLSALTRPFWISEQVVQAGVTAGVAHASRDSAARDELVRRAGLALRTAKKKHRGGVAQFEPGMDVEFDDRRFLEKELRRALDEAALDVHYQPSVAADGQRIVGAEALLRWNHPVRGAIAPMDFVPVAEQTGLMVRLGEYVLRRALADAVRWPGIYLSVNLSPVQVRDPALLGTVTSLLAKFKIPPARLMLEVTEGVLIDNPDEVSAKLDRLKALGVRLALDDFGTGYSSLTYLQRFSFDKLKIDRGFVAPLGRDQSGNALVHAIVALGRALGLTLLAEGVETEEQRVLLRMAGCEEMQGFLFARPCSREALDRLLAEAASAERAAVA